MTGGVLAGMLCALSVVAEEFPDLSAEPHRYHERTPRDRFTLLKPALESGALTLDTASELGFLKSLLRALSVPESSQMLVFSTTSLQLSLISPSNPRALYFNDDTYVGFIPGGKIEVISIDPELGGIFYIFEIPRDGRRPVPDRSGRCMNCHAGEDTREGPGLVIKSVIPGARGGSLTAYRLRETGHGIPLSDRFGGWYVTGEGALTNHHGNVMGKLSAGVLSTEPLVPGRYYSNARYPVGTTDIVPQLIHEHQAGFINRAVEANYRVRSILHRTGGTLQGAQSAEVDRLAETLVRYILFVDEAPFPSGGFRGEKSFMDEFQRDSSRPAGSVSLRTLDLRTRLMRYRCSYMIHSVAFEGLPQVLKDRILGLLREAVREGTDSVLGKHLESDERASIRHHLLAHLLPSSKPASSSN